MSTQKFLTIIETGPSSFGAFAPDIPGCIAFSTSRDETSALFRLAAEAHLQELADGHEMIPVPVTTEIPGLAIGVQSGAITLEWTTVQFPFAA